jgi:hypothetical protein
MLQLREDEPSDHRYWVSRWRRNIIIESDWEQMPLPAARAGPHRARASECAQSTFAPVFRTTRLTARACFAILLQTFCCNTTLWRAYDSFASLRGTMLVGRPDMLKFLPLVGRLSGGMSLATPGAAATSVS